MSGHATINRFYRLIWSEAQGAWIAVAEHTRGRGKSSGRGAFMAALFASLGLSPLAQAGAPPAPTQLPTGGVVTGGNVNIGQNGATMTVEQSSQRGAVDWQTFNVGTQARVDFRQPSSSAVTLNRVADTQASQIFGRITANGQVFLSNPNGVYFSPTASVDVGGLVATTHTISTADFMAGKNTLVRAGATGSVVNDGTLQAGLNGYIALLAPEVRNQGIVLAQAGTVALAAGEAIELQFENSRSLTGVLVTPASIATLVENGSAVHAPGGLIIMSAQAANQLQGGVVRNSGTLEATGFAERGGKIVLDSSGLVDNSGALDASAAAGPAGSVSVRGDRMASSGSMRADGGGAIASTLANGLVETTGALISAQGGGSITVDGGAGKVYTSASYDANGERGGKVVITANDVALMGAKVSATGVSAGGTILIGGDYQGKSADVRNAAKTSVGAGVTLNADATGNGNGGKVVVWSDEKTVFAGELTARGGVAGGDGGILEVSGKQTLHFGGKADAHAAQGKSGALLLDPKDIVIDSELSGQLELVDPHPSAGGSFGKINAALTTTSGSTVTRTGYIVVTNPNDNLGATDGGAAYLFRQSDQALISTIYGTHAGDKVGSNGVTSLTNGNYVVSSNLWNNGMGAVTWGNGTTGWGAGAVAVSSSNSLVGSHATHKSSMNQDTSDNIGGYAITVLNNGNYLVGTASWSDNRGALTFGDGSTGVSGIVSSANSLVGSTAMTVVPADGYKPYKNGDQVGSGVTVLANNNYVQANANWNKGVGAVTFASGTTGITGVVGSSNSLIGDATRFDATGAGAGTDKVGKYLTVLTGSQFVVYGSDWKNASGAVTSFDGVTPITGLVSASTSLVGNSGDNLSSGNLTLLPSNNAFVISSPSWNGGRGAATWVPFSTDVKTVSVASNGVVGATAGDGIGSKAIAALANNDYVVISPNWNSGKGAATLVDGTTGKAKADQSGVVSATTSLVGTQANDQVGSGGVLELKGNGNYVVLSPYWANGGNAKAGAVSWSSGSTPTVGAVGASNSLVGSSANDRIGSYQYNYYQTNNAYAFLSESSSVTLLSNGNYVVASPMFNGTRGAVTWSSGATGATADAGHTITASNSLLGSNTGDFIGGFMGPNDVITNAANQTLTHYDTISNGVTALANGNYVTVSNYWRNGAALRAGAVTWSDGAGAPTRGPVSASNSLVGSVQDDMVGLAQNNGYGIKLLENGYDSVSNPTYSGNYVVTSNKWNNGSIVDAGAVTWGSGTAALTGAISDSNSVLGLKTDDVKNWTVAALGATGNYLIQNQYWDNGAAIGAGALTWVDGSSGRLADYAAQGNHNIVSGTNSLVGSHTGDNVGGTVDFLYNYDAVNGRQRFTGNYVAISYNWTNDTRQYAGAVTWGNGATGVKGEITRANSLIGEKENDALGSYYVPLSNGNYLVSNPTLDVNGVVNAGGASWVDGSTGRLNDYAARGNQNIMSGANALVGSHTNDYVGTVLAPANYYALNTADYANNGYFISSADWNCSAGAINYISDASVPLIGVVGADNAAVGNPNGRFWGGLTYNPNISLMSGGAATVTFTGDNGHVVLLTPSMPTPSAMTLPGATQYADAEGATQAMTPDYIAGVLRTGTSVTLQANNDIFVKSGIDATGGTAGGALTMQAGRSITVLGDIITGNRDLNLVANDSVAHGVKDAYRDAGIATLSMGSNKQGVAARIDAGSGAVSLLIDAGADKTNNMAGSISVNSITARTIKLVNQGNGAGTVSDLPDLAANCCGFDLGYRGIGADVTLNAGAVLSASGAGTAVTLAAKGNFNNNSGNGAGSIAMSDPAARWLVYANAPGGSTYGGLDSQNTAIWNATYTGTPVAQPGNRYVFAYQPTITVGTQNVNKTYGEDLTAGTALVDRVVSLSGGEAAQAGAYLADTVFTALSGNIIATSSGAAANAGVAGGPYAITVDLSGATGNNGYAVALGSNTARTITVAPKTLTAALSGVTKVYDGSTTATLGAANYSLTGLVGSDAFNVTKATGVYNLSGTGASSASTTFTGGDFVPANGTLSSNYILPTSASGAASITPKILTATITGVSKTYDGSASATLSGANYLLNGFVGAESATVSQAAALYNSADVATASSVNASLAAPDFTAGAGTSLVNYVLPTSATGAATITPKALTASLTGAIVKTYDGSLTAVLNPGNYTLSGFIGGQSGGIAQAAGLYNSANVAGATTVTASLSSGDLVAGSATLASNYSLPATVSGAASIAPKALGVNLTGNLNRDYNAGTSATLSAANYALTGLAGADAFAINQTSGSYDSANAGNRTVSVALAGGDFSAASGTLTSNYVLPTSATGSATITPKSIVLTAPTISKVYDGTRDYTATAGDRSALGSVLLGSDSITGATLSYVDKNAGSGNRAVSLGSVTISDGNGGANYSVTLASNSSSTITPRALNVNATGVNRVYDATTNAAVTLGDDRVAGDDLVLSSASASFADKNAGVGKAVTVAGIAKTGADAGNYTLAGTTASATADITRATITTVTGITAGNKVYDGTTATTVSTTGATFAGMVNGDSLSATASGAFADKNAATGKTVNLSGIALGGLDAGNYTLASNTASTAADITRATISAVTGITVGNKVYDGTTAATVNTTGAAFVGMVNGDSLSATASGAFADKNAATGKTVQVSGIALGGLDAGNYTLAGTTASMTADITRATISAVTGITAGNKVYDGTTAATVNTTGAAFAGMVNGDSLSATASGAFADKNAAPGKTVQVSGIALGGLDAGNYTLASNTASTAADITKATIGAVTGITAGNKVYDGTTAATVNTTGAAFAGMVNGDSLSATASGAFADKNAATGKTVQVSGIALGGLDAGNYTLAATSASTTANIAQATLQVQGVTALERAYDRSLGVALGGTPTVTAFGNDVVTVLGTGSGAYADKNAGSGKAVTVTGYTSSDSNYVLLQPVGLTGTVTPAVLQLGGLSSGVTKTYDGTSRAPLSGAPVVTGFGGEAVSVLGTGSGSFADQNAGTGKAIIVSGYTASDSNYAIGQQPGLTGTIAPAQLGVAPITLAPRVYDGTNAAVLNTANFSLTGLVGSDSFVINKSSGAYDSANAGNRTLTVALSGADFSAGAGTMTGNYVLPTSATGNGVITAKAITLSAPSISKVYDGTLGYTTSAADLVGLSAALVQGDSVSSAALRYADKNAGAGNRTVTLDNVSISDGNGGANYSVTLAGNSSSTITPRTLNVNATAADRIYDAGTGASVTLTDDRILGDELAVATISASFIDKNAGIGKTVIVRGITTDGADAANYALASDTVTTRASIAQASLQVSGVTALERAYDRSLGVALGGTPTVTALGNDVVTVLGTGSGAYADKNAGSGKAVTVTGYTSSDSNYVLLQPVGLTGTVTPAVLQVSGLTVGATKTYDGTRVASLSGNAVVTGFAGEVVTVGGNGTGLFADKNAGQGKAIELSGFISSDSNYSIGQQPGLVGTIAPASVTVSGVRANNKEFDGTTVASLSGVAQVVAIGGDSLSVAGAPTASFADATVGTAKPVTVVGYTLAGADAGNYALSQPSGLVADIVNSAVVVPPPVTVPPPVLPAAPSAAEAGGLGLTLPPLASAVPSNSGALVAPAAAVPLAAATPVAAPAANDGVRVAGTAATATTAEVPAVASASAVKDAGSAGISVSLVREATLRQNGVVSVSVPKEIATSGQAYSFPLPAQIVEAAAVGRVAIVATTASGAALPSWITFDGASKTFVVSSAAPAGALPLQVQLQIGAQKAVIVIAEGQ